MARAESAIDRFLVRETVETYCDSLTRRDWDLLASVYAEDAVWHELPPVELKLQGRDQIVAGVSSYVANIRTLIMMPHSCIVKIDGDTATARTLIHEHGVAITGEPVSMYGLYQDRLARIGGRWRFTAREFHPIDWMLPGDFKEQLLDES